MPAIVAPSHRARGFDSINKPEFHQARQLCWQFNPAAHLCDDDTLTENLPALGDQVRTTRRWAPQAHICIDPVGFDSRHPRPHRDARNHSAFGAAWCAAAAKYLALGGVDEAAFTVGPGPAEAVQAELARLAGRQVRAAEIAGGIPAAVEALAIQDDGATLLWLANLTAQEQQVTLENLPPLRRLTFKSLGANGRARNLAPQTACDRGTAALSLAPHEVLQVHFAS
jgi:hypothetical protein